MDLGLDRVHGALAEVGNPHAHCTAIHIAGSNGKGSTSAMVESIARAAGLRTGMYTSPHLARFAERIRIAGDPIQDAPFDAALSAALHTQKGTLTFFECLTVAAFIAFAEAHVDLAVIEVGLGGRLDATNVIERPLACAITSISLEHTAVLGNTLGAIAREKAGILKPHCPYVLGALPAEAENAIDEAAQSVGAGPKWTTPVTVGKVGLVGPHQRQNASVATALAMLAASHFPGILKGIESGIAQTKWPGRYEKLPTERNITLLFDGAHNPEGAHALAGALAEEKLDPQRTTLLFGALADKSYVDVLRLVAYTSSKRVYTSPQGRAPAPLTSLAQTAPGEMIDNPQTALKRAVELTPSGGTVVITGSLYLVGEVRAYALQLPIDPVIPL
ncbi:MAG: bifunctional folylpolyglutamate synthase/dihydrofolate synthase [Polyangiaceae bacterium]|nr:bifunctional folylpolyglutamate synthase/dihydrofolate synthase [Polyangiaceae bacterium]